LCGGKDACVSINEIIVSLEECISIYHFRIIIPDVVLYEINLAKDNKPSLCKKRLKNLEILHIFSESGFINPKLKTELKYLPSPSIKGVSPNTDIDILRSVEKERAASNI